MSYYAACCCSPYVALVPCKGQTGTTYTTTAAVWATNFGITDFVGVWLVEVGGSEWCAEFQAAETTGTEPTGISISGVTGCSDPACSDTPLYHIFRPCVPRYPGSDAPCTFSMAATAADWATLLGQETPDFRGVVVFEPSGAATECCGEEFPCQRFCGTIDEEPTTYISGLCDAECPGCDVDFNQVKLIDSSFSLGTFTRLDKPEYYCEDPQIADECTFCRVDNCDKPYLKLSGVTTFRYKTSVNCLVDVPGDTSWEGGGSSEMDFWVGVSWTHYFNANAETNNPEDLSAGTSVCERTIVRHTPVPNKTFINSITYLKNEVRMNVDITRRDVCPGQPGLSSSTRLLASTTGTVQFGVENNESISLTLEPGDLLKSQNFCTSIHPEIPDNEGEIICTYQNGCYYSFYQKWDYKLRVAIATIVTNSFTNPCSSGGSGYSYTCSGTYASTSLPMHSDTSIMNPDAILCCCDAPTWYEGGYFLGGGKGNNEDINHEGTTHNTNWGQLVNQAFLFNALYPDGEFAPNCGDTDFLLDLSLGAGMWLGRPDLVFYEGGPPLGEDILMYSGNRCSSLDENEQIVVHPCFDPDAEEPWICDVSDYEWGAGVLKWEWDYTTGALSSRFLNNPAGGKTRTVSWLMNQTVAITEFSCVEGPP